MPFLAAAVSSWTARRTNANRAPDAHTDFVDVENPGASLSFEEYEEESEASPSLLPLPLSLSLSLTPRLATNLAGADQALAQVAETHTRTRHVYGVPRRRRGREAPAASSGRTGEASNPSAPEVDMTFPESHTCCVGRSEEEEAAWKPEWTNAICSW